MNRRNNVKKNNSLLLVFIIFLTSFLLGVLFCFKITNYFKGDLLKNYYNISIDNKTNDKIDLSKWRLIYDIIKNNYYDSNIINDNDLIEGSIYGLVNGLNDKHSSYLNVQENTEFMDSLSGDFEGIGAVVAVHALGVEVDRIIKGSPAQKYDIRAGDIIISANGVSFDGFSVTEAVSYIKGEAGTKVEIEIIRPEEKNILKKELIREKIKIPSVETEEINDNIGYISINMFGDETSKEFKDAINEFKEKQGIVIDLRYNGGGYLLSAVEILGNLIERGEVLVVTKYKDEKINEYYKSINNGNIYKGKIVVLINESSASASEIVAGALKEHEKAIIVGKNSYGKGSVQKPFELADGSMVKLTIAKWFTPKGVNIDEEGISPDIEINFLEEDYVNIYDRQKEESFNILNQFIANDNIKNVIEEYSIKE